VWPKLLLFAFVLWFIWAFLNDSQGRLWTWTDGKCPLASSPSQEVLDKRAAAEKAKAGKNGTNSTTSVTNAMVTAASTVVSNAPAAPPAK